MIAGPDTTHAEPNDGPGDRAGRLDGREHAAPAVHRKGRRRQDHDRCRHRSRPGRPRSTGVGGQHRPGLEPRRRVRHAHRAGPDRHSRCTGPVRGQHRSRSRRCRLPRPHPGPLPRSRAAHRAREPGRTTVGTVHRRDRGLRPVQPAPRLTRHHRRLRPHHLRHRPDRAHAAAVEPARGVEHLPRDHHRPRRAASGPSRRSKASATSTKTR